jgi:hypothetical protein
VKQLSVSFEKAWLEDESAVDQYLQALKQKMMDEINNGKRIQT